MGLLSEYFQNENFLFFLQVILIVLGITSSLNLFLPKGIESYQKWKEKRMKIDLVSAVNNVSIGLFILFYLLGAFLIALGRR